MSWRAYYFISQMERETLRYVIFCNLYVNVNVFNKYTHKMLDALYLVILISLYNLFILYYLFI